MMIMLLFNYSETPVLTFQNILEGTKIEEQYLMPALLSLAHPKSKVLLLCV
jgi:hypothetical protein